VHIYPDDAGHPSLVNGHVVHRHLGGAGLPFGIADAGTQRLPPLDQITARHQRVERRIEGVAGN
jgi:hypothetical protein